MADDKTSDQTLKAAVERVTGRAESLERIGADQDAADLRTLLAALSSHAEAVSLFEASVEHLRDHYDMLVNLANGNAVYEVVNGKRTRRKLSEVIAAEADAGSKFARTALSQYRTLGDRHDD